MKRVSPQIIILTEAMTKFIPSIFTSINLICGFIALIIGDHYVGSLLLLFAVGFDVMDGLAARALNAQSEIGKELYSLADLVSFGIAPAYLYYLLSPIDTWVGFIPPCILVASSALRLAIFNTKPSSDSFSGLPTPATALFLVGIFLAYSDGNLDIVNLLNNSIIYFGMPFFFAAMMLSKIKMFSFKNINKGISQNKAQLIFLLSMVAFALLDVNLAFSLCALNYIFLSILSNRFSTLK